MQEQQKAEYAESRSQNVDRVNPPTLMDDTFRATAGGPSGAIDSSAPKHGALDTALELAQSKDQICVEATGTGELVEGGIIDTTETGQNATTEMWLKLKRQKQTGSALGLAKEVGLMTSDYQPTPIETPGVTLTRLANELQEFQSAIRSFAQQGNTNLKLSEDQNGDLLAKDLQNMFAMDGFNMLNEIERLQNEMNALKNDEEMNKIINILSDDKLMEQFDNKDVQELLSHFNNLQTEIITTKKEEKTNNGSKAPQLTQSVEIFVPSKSMAIVSGVSDLDMLVEYNQLESRVMKLEEVFGLDKFSSVGFAFPDISSAIAQLTERLILLDPKHVEALGRRVADLNKDIDRLVTLKGRQGILGASVGGSTKDRGSTSNSSNLLNIYAQTTDFKIEALYNELETWKHVVHLLPRIVTKVKYMGTVQRSCANMGDRVASLEDGHAKMRVILQSVESSVDRLEASMAEQAQLMKDILQSQK